jgi:hypothetical protein
MIGWLIFYVISSSSSQTMFFILEMRNNLSLFSKLERFSSFGLLHYKPNAFPGLGLI